MANYRYLLVKVLPKFGLYATSRSTLARHPTLETVPRVLARPTRERAREWLRSYYGAEPWPDSDTEEHWLAVLHQYFNPWVAAWAEASLWHFVVPADSPGSNNQGWFGLEYPLVVFLGYIDEMGRIHEVGHAWESAKVDEGVPLDPETFTSRWLLELGNWPTPAMRSWARGFKEKVIDQDRVLTETYASTASAVMGDLGKLPSGLVPYFAPLFSGSSHGI